MWHSHSSYLMRAGGEGKAISDLKSFHAARYSCTKVRDSELALKMVTQHTEETSCRISVLVPRRARAVEVMAYPMSCSRDALRLGSGRPCYSC